MKTPGAASRAGDLLNDLLQNPLEPGYADAARRRAEEGPRTGWRSRGARASKLVVLVLTGFLLAVAWRQVVAAEPQVSRARSDLVADVKHRQDAADDLQRQADRLREDVAREGDAALGSDDLAGTLRSRAAAAGLGKVRGKGLTVRLTDAPPPTDPVTGKTTGENLGVVQDRDLQDIANALWYFGAEAVAINGQRLTATSTIRTAGGAILVDFRPVTGPYQVAAVGPSDLHQRFDKSATARRFRGFTDRYHMGFSIKKNSALTLPAAPEPRLRYAHPPSPSTSPSVSSTPSPARPASPSRSPVRSGTGG